MMSSNNGSSELLALLSSVSLVSYCNCASLRICLDSRDCKNDINNCFLNNNHIHLRIMTMSQICPEERVVSKLACKFLQLLMTSHCYDITCPQNDSIV